MLKLDDPQFLWELYRSGVRRRDRAMRLLDDELARYCGPSWTDEGAEGDTENPEFEMVAQLVPRIVWDNPRARVTTVRPGAAQQVARALHHGINRNIITTDIRKVAKRVCVDAMFRYGVLYEEIEDQPQYGVIPHPLGPMAGAPFIPQRPRTRRISMRRYGQDPTATCEEEVRFRFHEEIHDIDDLVARAEAHPEEGWNTKLLGTLRDDVDVDRVHRPKQEGENPKRGEVAAVHMYLDGAQLEGSELTKDQGYNGVVATLFLSGADENGNQQAEWLREPYMLFCPPRGPYTLVGEYIVPDDETPLAGIQAGAAILTERQAHQRALARAAARRKKIGIGDGLDSTTNLEIRDAEDGDWIVAPGFQTAKAAEFEFGGITEPAMAYKQYLDIKADRLLGSDDASRGSVTGRGTATENQIAFEATNTRTGGRQRTFQDALADHLRIKAWYLFHKDRIAFPVPPELAQQGGMPPDATMGADGMVATPPDNWFHGGNVQPGSGFTFDDLELCIEPYSMTRTSPEVQAATGAFLAGPFLEMAQALIANPAIPPDKYMAAVADSFNNPTLVDLLDVKIVRLLQGFGLMAMVTPSAQQDPRLAGDVGAGAPLNVTMPMQGGVQLGGRPGAFGSSPERTGAGRIGMKPAGPAGRETKKPAAAGARK